VKEKLENFGNELYEMRFNMKTGSASQKKLSASAVDFPRIYECYTGLLTRRLSSLLLLSLLSPLIVFIILPIPLLSDSPVQSEINLISPCDVQSQLRKKFPKLNDPLLSLGILMTSLHLLLLLPSGLVSRL
jgi:hypothetical protein